MSDYKNLIVNEFLLKERPYLSQLESYIQLNPMTYEQKIDCYESILRKGINFGISKGIFMEQVRTERVKYANNIHFQHLVDDLIFDLNNDIMKFKNLPKVKYSKKKYKIRRTTRQLSLLEQFGYNVDVV